MNKKEIGIVAGIGIFVIMLTVGVMYILMNKKPITDNKKKTDIQVGSYTIKFGKYKGYSEEYNPNTETIDKDEVIIEITDNYVITGGTSQSYKIEGKNIVTAGNLQIAVIGNNKLNILAGGGVELSYEE